MLTINELSVDLRHPLAARLDWLHRLLAWQVQATRATFGALADDPYRGLYIPDGEVDVLLSDWPAMPADLAAMRRELADDRRRLEESAAPGDPFRRIQALFGLTALETDALLLALAPEFDLRYERLYGYIQDDVGKRRPTVDLALRLLCPAPAERVAARQMFTAAAPLLRYRLLVFGDDGQRQSSLLSRPFRLDDRIASELLGGDGLDPAVQPFLELRDCQAGSGAPPRQAQAAAAGGSGGRGATHSAADALAMRLRSVIADGAGGLVIGLQGRPGGGRLELAETVCASLARPLLVARVEQAAGGRIAPDEAFARILREALLRGAAVAWDGVDLILHDDPARDGAQIGHGDPLGGAARAALLAALDGGDPLGGGLSFFLIDQPWEARSRLRHTRYLRLELPPLTYAEREQLWRDVLGAGAFDDDTFQALASTFRLNAGQIRASAAMARSLGDWHRSNAGDDARASQRDLYAACRAQSSDKLSRVARAITPTYAWEDIVLPSDQIRQLHEICLQVRHRRIVLDTWGFDRHLAMGKGVNVLFAGPSGTGKTMAAEIIARDLGLELYKIDLASMVSKYIGETEKNLDAVFTAAREANTILLFDEADSLFGKRSEVRDAHDRYANIEVGYLLQKMEEYDGVVILSTNLRNNMDDAFVRRLHVTIDFPLPEEADRQRIWRRSFPAQTPLADDVDFERLARQFKMTGGNIRNIALLAAFLAADAGSAVGMPQIIWAIKREYQKIGKLVTESDFGAYLAMARR